MSKYRMIKLENPNDTKGLKQAERLVSSGKWTALEYGSYHILLKRNESLTVTN